MQTIRCIWLVALICVLFPTLAFADGTQVSMSFVPDPATAADVRTLPPGAAQVAKIWRLNLHWHTFRR